MTDLALRANGAAHDLPNLFWFGRSIRQQLLLAIAVMLAIAAAIAGTIAVMNGRKAVDIEVRASLDFAEGYLRELVRRIAAENRLADLDYLVAREVQHLRHARVYIQDPGAPPKLLQPTQTLKDDETPLDDTPDWFESLMSPPDIDHSRLILVPKGERSLLLKGDPDDEIAEKWRELSALSIVAIVSLAALVATFHFLLGWILNPLVGLAKGLVALEEGQRSQRLDVPHVNEVADIARKFNSLAASLDQARAENGDLYRQIQSVQETERREIARELHDEAGPCLFGITANAESVVTLAGRLSGREAKDIGKRAEEVLQIAGRMKAMNRDLLKRLHPVSMGKVPLSALIQDLVCDFERRHPELDISTSVALFEGSCGERVDLTVYRSTQEALTNAIRHGRAQSIRIEIAGQTGERGAFVSLRIVDDGQGFGPEAKIGFGLSAMRERVLAAGGSLAITANEPRGTQIFIRIPYQPRLSAPVACDAVPGMVI